MNRHYRLYFAITSSLAFISDFAEVAYATIAQVTLYAISAVAPASAFVWRIPPALKLIAYRTIGLLKPDYRESYDTHGLSLDCFRQRF